MIWFHSGYVEYRFPNKLPSNAAVERLTFSAEICSEAPMHHEDWPSNLFGSGFGNYPQDKVLRVSYK